MEIPINELSHNPHLIAQDMTLRAYYAGHNMKAMYDAYDKIEDQRTEWPTDQWRILAAQEAIKGAEELIKQLTNS